MLEMFVYFFALVYLAGWGEVAVFIGKIALSRTDFDLWQLRAVCCLIVSTVDMQFYVGLVTSACSHCSEITASRYTINLA